MSDEENNDQGNQDVIDSGVEGISADDLHNNTPVFDVEKSDFFNNMRKDRNRMRFGNETKPSQFMQGTKYRKPFYVRYQEKNGEKFMYKVK